MKKAQRNKIRKASLLMALILQQVFTCCFATAQTSKDIADMTAARSIGEKIANTGQSTVTSFLNHGDAQNEIKKAAGYDEQKAANIQGRGTDLGNSPTLGANAKEQSLIFSKAATDARDEKLDDEYGFRKGEDKFTVDNNGYMDKAKKNVHDASSKFDFLNGKYKKCEPRDETIKYKAEEVCDEYYHVNVSECLANQVVEIDPKQE